MSDKFQTYLQLLKNNDTELLNYLRAKFPFFHNSNFFFRDFQYGIRSFLEKKEIKASYQMAEKLANEMAKYFEEQKVFVKNNHQGWKINKPEFVTAEPGDPF
ncbi:MAG: hypothetical protein OQJ93_02750 [Ignavibacteriaceae bacterium]|jgi:hypothetical protein|nr:hypothetical protein [Ignavibacteriaceae bacterium]MCW8822909.1 hypothetical protein [Ignavibacteriaceae bacterium]MCW9096284.1 hypothetical protein [Ignavibacteriaceae bacterium]